MNLPELIAWHQEEAEYEPEEAMFHIEAAEYLAQILADIRGLSLDKLVSKEGE